MFYPSPAGAGSGVHPQAAGLVLLWTRAELPGRLDARVEEEETWWRCIQNDGGGSHNCRTEKQRSMAWIYLFFFFFKNWMCLHVSCRNRWSCSIWTRTIRQPFRFPWRANVFRECTTPGETTHWKTEQAGPRLVLRSKERSLSSLSSCMPVWWVLGWSLHNSPWSFQCVLCRPPTPLILSLPLRCDPSDINISDEMSKTTVWKSLNSNQKDIQPVAAKKARPCCFVPSPSGDIPAAHYKHLLMSCVTACYS